MKKRLERIRLAATEWPCPPDVTVEVSTYEMAGTGGGDAVVRLEGLDEPMKVGFTVDDSRALIQRNMGLAADRLRQKKANRAAVAGDQQ